MISHNSGESLLVIPFLILHSIALSANNKGIKKRERALEQLKVILKILETFYLLYKNIVLFYFSMT